MIERITDLGIAQQRLRANFGDPIPLIARTGALLRGHFALLNGRHSEYFLRTGPLARNMADLRQVVHELTFEYPAHSVLMVTETTAIYVGHALASITGTNLVVLTVDSLRRPHQFREPFSPGARVILVTDFATSGANLVHLAATASAVGGVVVGAFALAASKEFEVPNTIGSLIAPMPPAARETVANQQDSSSALDIERASAMLAYRRMGMNMSASLGEARVAALLRMRSSVDPLFFRVGLTALWDTFEVEACPLCRDGKPLIWGGELN